MKRDYLAAMDQYIKLAIGNAPWPIGVTMVGIHERSAREKIYTNSVAHIMNDETTRKYLQSIKRLMTLCQRRYPALPSKSVEFNSLANGSDLQALLSEENGSGKASEERLRLMPASKDWCFDMLAWIKNIVRDLCVISTSVFLLSFLFSVLFHEGNSSWIMDVNQIAYKYIMFSTRAGWASFINQLNFRKPCLTIARPAAVVLLAIGLV